MWYVVRFRAAAYPDDDQYMMARGRWAALAVADVEAWAASRGIKVTCFEATPDRGRYARKPRKRRRQQQAADGS